MPAYPKPKIKEYVRPVPSNWWLKRPAYTKFMLRELSAGVIAIYALLLLRLMHRAGGNPDNFQEFFEFFKSPVSIVLHVIFLGFALMNTLTTFNLAPRVFKLHRGEEKVPESVIAGVHYVMWAVTSIILFFILLRA